MDSSSLMIVCHDNHAVDEHTMMRHGALYHGVLDHSVDSHAWWGRCMLHWVVHDCGVSSRRRTLCCGLNIMVVRCQARHVSKQPIHVIQLRERHASFAIGSQARCAMVLHIDGERSAIAVFNSSIARGCLIKNDLYFFEHYIGPRATDPRGRLPLIWLSSPGHCHGAPGVLPPRALPPSGQVPLHWTQNGRVQTDKPPIGLGLGAVSWAEFDREVTNGCLRVRARLGPAHTALVVPC